MRVKIFLAQLNPIVGDLKGNMEKALMAVAEAERDAVEIVILPEMFLSGYQLQDLVLKRSFLNDVNSSLSELALKTRDKPALMIGAPSFQGEKIFNSYFLLKQGSIALATQKYHLPNNDVFDEPRYFHQGVIGEPLQVSGCRIGTPICEDIWYPDVVTHMKSKGADLIISPNGSPYSRGKIEVRKQIATLRVSETAIPLIYLNLVGGQDDQIFDGGSFAINLDGKIVCELPQFEEATFVVEYRKGNIEVPNHQSSNVNSADESFQDYRAMCVALEDYVIKSGFSKVLVGLSGGIDSALVATIAVDALGKDNVLCIRLPSVFTSTGSLDDAENLVGNLGCSMETISISGVNEEILTALAPFLSSSQSGLTEENIQARIRGLLLMAVSNKSNSMLLTTGNKSEVAVGYSTIYGDMAGGYNPIKDLYKTRVFKISEWRNKNHFNWMLGPKGEVIPKNIIAKPPTAELRPGQLDQDSLPPYEILDKILEGLIEEDLSIEQLVHKGYDRGILKMVETLIFNSEYKRYQAAPGVHLTDKSFWLGRRYPIVQKWRDKS